ncbi:MAG: CPBP family intramembrane metalloprotease [Cyclobacteriaceae bacterium]|nr:CPBP family intramembrane metalloprotease [Cyclobacteriaceae bacterium]
MRQIWDMLVAFVRETWNLRLYLSVAILLVISITLNYLFDFQDTYIRSLGSFWVKWLAMFLFMLMPFLVVCGILYAAKFRRHWITSRDFWICTLVGFAILGFDRSFTGFASWIDHLNRVDFYFYFRILSKATSLLTLVLPLLIFYWLYEQPKDPLKTFYGLRLGKTKLGPYFKLLAVASMFIILGSFMGDLSGYYPRYAVSGGVQYAHAHELPFYVPVLMYESAYGSNFIGVELFFRGYLILAFTRTLGPYAVLAMVPAYAFLHFGKPLPETISSVFGGYILGVITYNTRNIYGGIIVHVGIAWLMELMGYLQNL